MVNKLWYEKNNLDGIWCFQDKSRERQYIQKFIDLYCPKLFKVPEDVTPDNLQQFLEVILIQYQYYNIDLGHLSDIGEDIDTYFSYAFAEDFSEHFPAYLDSDRRQLTLYIWDECLSCAIWHLLPEDIPFLIECLNTPDDQVICAYDRLEAYFSQFDMQKRCNEEISKRWSTINRQRLEALEKGDPLPIRPMGIEFSMCYKDGLEPKE